jgi:hypothetical protein
VLQAYGLHAVSFVISGRLDTHGFYYLHPDELRQMINSGRWDVEAATYHGRELVPVSAYGKGGPFLTSRAWLPQHHRLETLAEYRRRVGRDLDMNISELRSYGANPQLFAYPLAPMNAPESGPRVIPVLRDLVDARFPVSFVDASKSRYLDRWDGASPQELPRFEVFRGTTPRGLLRRLLGAEPLAPSTSAALRQPDDWTFEGLSPQRGRHALGTHTLALSPLARHWQAAYYALARSDSWKSYRLQTVISGFGAVGRGFAAAAGRRQRSVASDGTSASVLLANTPRANAPRYAVTVSAARLTVTALPPRGSPRQLVSVRLAPNWRHMVALELVRRRLEVDVDGHARANVRVSGRSHGGVGLGVWRSGSSRQPVRFSHLHIEPA